MSITIEQNITRAQLLAGAGPLFAQFNGLESFGWHQCTDRWVDGRNVTFEESLSKPDISGALGEKYIDNDGRQKAVAEFLKKFDKYELLDVFGDGVDVCLYRDGSIEVTDDSYRPLVFEL